MEPFRGSFSAVSTPIFTIKDAFFRIFQTLHVYLCTIPDFCDFSELLHHFLANLTQFLLIFLGDSRFRNFSSILNFFFFGISQNFNDFGKSDAKILIFLRNLRNFAEILQNYDAKLLEICPKKMDPLNPHGGNSCANGALSVLWRTGESCAASCSA